jgi:hypothetical protein
VATELPEAWQAGKAAPPWKPEPKPGLHTLELPVSKAIARLHYDEGDRTLVVEFRNFGVPRDDYTRLATSASPGARFNRFIAAYHEYERLH